MSDDNTKPEPRHWARALADVPDAGTIGERHAITFELLGAIGNELAAQRSAVVPAVPAIADGKAETTGDSDAHRRQLALGGWLQAILDGGETARSTMANGGDTERAVKDLEAVVPALVLLSRAASVLCVADLETGAMVEAVSRSIDATLARWQEQQPATEEPT